MDLSVVVPIFNEQENISLLVRSLQAVLSSNSVEYEIILVDDASSDRSWEVIASLSAVCPEVKGIRLARNFGPQSAVFAAFSFATGNAIVTMDGDLQHPPEVIPQLIQQWRQGNFIVETLRKDAPDFSMMKRVASRVFSRVFAFLSGMKFEHGLSDFRLLDRAVVNVILTMRDPSIFLRGMTHWVGFPRSSVKYSANARHAGLTKWNFSRLLAYSFRSVLAFSIKPLKLGIIAALLTSCLAFVELIYIFVRYFQGMTVPGWASILTVVSFMFAVLFLLLGIIGAYVGEIFEVIKNRPRFIVRDTVGAIVRRSMSDDG